MLLLGCGICYRGPARELLLRIITLSVPLEILVVDAGENLVGERLMLAARRSSLFALVGLLLQIDLLLRVGRVLCISHHEEQLIVVNALLSLWRQSDSRLFLRRRSTTSDSVTGGTSHDCGCFGHGGRFDREFEWRVLLVAPLIRSKGRLRRVQLRLFVRCRIYFHLALDDGR